MRNIAQPILIYIPITHVVHVWTLANPCGAAEKGICFDSTILIHSQQVLYPLGRFTDARLC